MDFAFIIQEHLKTHPSVPVVDQYGYTLYVDTIEGDLIYDSRAKESTTVNINTIQNVITYLPILPVDLPSM